MNIVLASMFSLILFSCAGPTNPFGGDVFISEEFSINGSSARQDVTLEVSPDRQYYNSPYDLTLKINDPKFQLDKFRYEVVYNNKRLNRWYQTEEVEAPKKKGDPIKVHFKNLSILPGNINKISFLYYPVGSKYPVTYKLRVPECYQDIKSNNLSISPFQVGSNLKNNIEMISEKYGYNASLVAALIAQESSFNPTALSFAKALGLTQVTPLAHHEINKYKPEWKIYPKFTALPYLNLKSKLYSNVINKKNDWRLDQEKSIEGGILYLNYLNQYWDSPEKMEILGAVFEDEIPKTDILLASYNSGAFRVKKSILKNKKDWLFDQSLNEARKYVMNIKSYCYAFNQGEENEK